MSFKGRGNVYHCPDCGQPTVTIDADEGVTPFLLDCRATPGCRGLARSSFYPPPSALLRFPQPSWEWYRPNDAQLRRLKRRDPQTAEHVEMGGLLLRRRSAAS